MIGTNAGCLAATPSLGAERREFSRTCTTIDGLALRVRNQNGPLRVEAVEGDAIETEAVVQGPTVEAVDTPSIIDERSDRTLSLETDYGGADASVGLTIRCPGTVRIDQLKTSNASIEADIARTTAETTVRTDNGRIEATLAPSLDAVVRASTSNSSIELDGVDLEDIQQTESSLSGIIGEGTNTLVLETSNASIDIDRLQK